MSLMNIQTNPPHIHNKAAPKMIQNMNQITLSAPNLISATQNIKTSARVPMPFKISMSPHYHKMATATAACGCAGRALGEKGVHD